MNCRINFLTQYFFDKKAFSFDPELLNKLAPERHEDFKDYVWKLDRADYPIHTIVQKIQLYTLYSVFHPRRLSRIHDNEIKNKEEKYHLMMNLTNMMLLMLKDGVH